MKLEHRIVRITRYGTPNAVQIMFIIMGNRHRLLHMRALLANTNRGKQEIHPVHDGPLLYSRLLY